MQLNLPPIAGQFGAAYAIPIIYVPLLMLTHLVAFYLLPWPNARTPSASSPLGKPLQA